MFLPLVPGNEAAKSYFARAISVERVSHAYLLVGPDSAASAQFAKELAKVFYCAESRACGSCSGCTSIEHSNHPDVNVYGPAEGKTAVDIDTIRALCERTHYRSSGLQIVILEHADQMNEPAANALLKTLEEPLGSALLILLAQSTGSLLSTIVSRCHRVYLRGSGELQSVLPESATEALEESSSPMFFAHCEAKGWLGRALPDEEGSRAALRKLLGGLVVEWRARLQGAEGVELDAALGRLGAFIELRQDLDRNVSPELVLERTWRTLRRGA